tara:strand:- start:468 stop:713 length:246 start_codon:yes stop_codon:yes gene_type:complete
MVSYFSKQGLSDIDIKYSREIIPKVGFICGILFTVSGVSGIIKSTSGSVLNNSKYLIVSSVGLLFSGYYLISYFYEYNKQV